MIFGWIKRDFILKVSSKKATNRVGDRYMTEQQAMEIIMQVAYDGEFPLNSNEAFGVACKCIAKQIPIELEKQGYFKVCKCGCEMSTFLMHNRANYCPNCGQALKWE